MRNTRFDRRYNLEFREMAVKTAIASDNRAAVARKLGIPYSKLRDWTKAYLKRLKKEQMLEVNTAMQEELKAKDKRIEELLEELEIVKKAAAYFSKDLL